jgi:hypothetical protein
MSERREFTHNAPAKPIVLRPHHPELEPQALADPARPRSHMTRRRIVYLVGLTLQAAVLAAVVGAFLAYEAPIRAALGLTVPNARLEAAMQELDAKVSLLSTRVDLLSGAVGRVEGGHDHAGGAGDDDLRHGDSIAVRVDRIDDAVARLEERLGAAPAAAVPAQ